MVSLNVLATKITVFCIFVVETHISVGGQERGHSAVAQGLEPTVSRTLSPFKLKSRNCKIPESSLSSNVL